MTRPDHETDHFLRRIPDRLWAHVTRYAATHRLSIRFAIITILEEKFMKSKRIDRLQDHE